MLLKPPRLAQFILELRTVSYSAKGRVSFQRAGRPEAAETRRTI
jgi:hypothetical protein